MKKRPFDIDLAIKRIGDAVSPFPKAGMFELFAEGFGSPFELLIACLISIRTLDEVMVPCARRLFGLARTPQEMNHLTLEQIDTAIAESMFHERKAQQIHDIAHRIVKEYGGSLPCQKDVLVSFRGVGPKCANLVLGIASDQPYIGVDIHVHRITNRWGYVQEKSPEQTLIALEEKLPRKYWIDINRLLVPFGKHICTGRLPRCSTCTMVNMCQQVGVEKRR
ncbi:endonuclease III [Chloroflexi bacterium TSY]|nr:endonuclease III [Chloroflexi bacterium TSY]